METPESESVTTSPVATGVSFGSVMVRRPPPCPTAVPLTLALTRTCVLTSAAEMSVAIEVFAETSVIDPMNTSR